MCRKATSGVDLDRYCERADVVVDLYVASGLVSEDRKRVTRSLCDLLERCEALYEVATLQEGSCCTYRLLERRSSSR